MPTAEDLLKDPTISEYLQSHQGAAKRIRNAAQELAKQPDGRDALKKLLPSLTEDKVKVFFSYKKKDEAAAKVVVNLLRQKSAKRLAITFQGDFANQAVGTEWRKLIRGSVQQANWFLLLLPDPADDLDWCLFETGLFEAQLTSADRLICLHHPKRTIPDPIRDYHAVAAETDNLVKFLHMVFAENNPIPGMEAINPEIKDEIPALAEQIREAIRSPLQLQILQPWIALRVNGAQKLKTRDDLDAAEIIDASPKALQVFKLLAKKDTFGQLRSQIQETKLAGEWREDLAHTIQNIRDGFEPGAIQTVFESPHGQMFRPVVHAVNRFVTDNSIDAFQVTFNEEMAAPDTAAMPKDLGTLAMLVRFTFRFRWEVLERFSQTPLNSDDVDRLIVNLDRINADWKSRGVIDEEAIARLFPDPEATERLQQMFIAWRKLRNDEGTGELDIAIKNKDGALIQKQLASVIPLNRDFLEMSATRFAEMVSSHPHP